MKALTLNHRPQPSSKFQVPSSDGFTAVELAVVIAIITALSAIALVSFTGVREGAALNRSARELALAVRRAQNMSLAVTQVETPEGALRTPPAAGLRLEVGEGSYVLFADFARDNRYDSANDVGVAETRLERGVGIGEVAYYDAFGNRRSVPTAHIVFAAPEAAVTLSDQSGGSLGEALEITLVTSVGRLTKIITVRTSGQVSIR